MYTDISYKIFSESLHHPFHILEDPTGNILYFSRHNWENCKLTKDDNDLVNMDVMKYQSIVIALNFTFETTLNNILFSRSSSFSYKVKGSYFSKELKDISWKWKISSFCSTKLALIDKKHNNMELAKIKIFEMNNKISGSLTISNLVPSELHTLIVASACLAVNLHMVR
jgi:hypothetical protein